MQPSSQNPALRIVQKLFARGSANSSRRRFAATAFSSFGIKIFSLAVSFATNILLTRLLGVSDYGAYVYAIAWVSFLGIPASLGLSEYLVREVALYQTHSRWSLLKGLLQWSNQTALVLATAIAILAAGVSWYLPIGSNQTLLFVLWMAFASLPITVLTSLRQGTMKGLNRVVVGDLPEQLIRPILFAVLIGAAFLALREKLSVLWVMGIYILSVAIAFLVGIKLLHKFLPKQVKTSSPTYDVNLWIRSTVPFLMIVGLYTINSQTDVLMLGAIDGTEAAGIYTVLGRGVQLLQFVLAAVCSAVGPAMVSVYAAQDRQQLQRVVQSSARMVFLASLAVTAALTIFGYWFLLIFGAEFTQGQSALTILCVGNLLSSAAGIAGHALLMTGHERDTAMATGVSAVLNVILNALLIPAYGLEGAAIATAVSLVVRGLYFWVAMRRRLGITMRLFL